MRKYIILFLLIIPILCSAQKHNKRQFNKIINKIDSDTLLNIISFSTILDDKTYTYNQYSKDDKVLKIKLVCNLMSEDYIETYYYDSSEKCIRYVCDVNNFGENKFKFEVNYYSKDRVEFFLNKKQVYFSESQRINIIDIIANNLKFYKKLFK